MTIPWSAPSATSVSLHFAGVRRPNSAAAVMMAAVLGVTPSTRARSPALSLGQGLHRLALVEHRVGGPAAVGAGEDRQQLGVAQRADPVPLEAFPGDEARGARVRFR